MARSLVGMRCDPAVVGDVAEVVAWPFATIGPAAPRDDYSRSPDNVVRRSLLAPVGPAKMHRPLRCVPPSIEFENRVLLSFRINRTRRCPPSAPEASVP
jgi:hypothetical protein